MKLIGMMDIIQPSAMGVSEITSNHLQQDLIDLQLIYFVYCASREGAPCVTFTLQQTSMPS